MRRVLALLFTSLQAELFWVIVYWLMFGIVAPIGIAIFSVKVAEYTEVATNGSIGFWECAPVVWLGLTFWIVYHNIRVVRIGRRTLIRIKRKKRKKLSGQ